MTKGDKVTVKRGPLSGMEIVLHRRDNANRAWYGDLKGGERVLVWDYELAETIERKKREVKRG